MNFSRRSTVLVSVLDWGLGHASRTAVIVRTLLSRGCRVVLAGSGRSLALLTSEFQGLQVVSLPSFSPRLSGGRWLWAEVMAQTPVFLLSVLFERWRTEALVRRLAPDLVLSDNRYGVRSSRCRSVFVTHQLSPMVSPSAPRWLNGLLAKCLGLLVGRFDACLVPDFALGGLSGSLSYPSCIRIPLHRIGILSRLAYVVPMPAGRVDWLGITSGPQPQRRRFADSLIRRFEALPGRRVVVCADSAVDGHIARGGVEVVGLASPAMLKGLILAAEHIVCRSGYSTLMDLAALGRLDDSIELVPTPGQAEQVYLARRVKEIVAGEHLCI